MPRTHQPCEVEAEIIDRACKIFNVTKLNLLGKRNAAATVGAREWIIRHMKEKLRWGNHKIGKALHRNPETINRMWTRYCTSVSEINSSRGAKLSRTSP